MANISEAELNAAIRALQDKGIPDDQIKNVLQAMRFGETSAAPSAEKAQVPMTARDVGALGMMASNNPLAAALMMANRQPEMSQSDGINMVSRDRDVPGAYVDQYSKSMDAYGQHMIRQEAAAIQSEAMHQANHTLPLDPYQGNPNVRIETEGQRSTVGPNGQLIIY